MLVTKTISRNKTHGRCGTPDCDWGTPLTMLGKSELSRFRERCIERHGLDPDDTERMCWFDPETLTLTLLDA
jgi:hypothetical protein